MAADERGLIANAPVASALASEAAGSRTQDRSRPAATQSNIQIIPAGRRCQGSRLPTDPLCRPVYAASTMAVPLPTNGSNTT
jgi:hypothetical protein